MDTASISRNVVVDVPVVADAGVALEKLLEWAEKKDTAKWQEQIHRWEKENPLAMRRDRGISPQMIMEHINAQFPHSIYVTDVGQHQMWATQYLELDEQSQLITSGGLGTMGFGFPAAIGAKIANPKKPVVCITGDGGFQMNIQEMATAVTQGTGITICLLNNNYLGNVRQWQAMFFNRRYSFTPMMNPDYMQIASAYGIPSRRVAERGELEEAIREMLDTDGPFLLEACVIEEGNVLPMTPPGSSVNYMMLDLDC